MFQKRIFTGRVMFAFFTLFTSVILHLPLSMYQTFQIDGNNVQSWFKFDFVFGTVAPDGGYVSVGTSFYSPYDDVVVIKFNFDGTLDWTSTIGNSSQKVTTDSNHFYRRYSRIFQEFPLDIIELDGYFIVSFLTFISENVFDHGLICLSSDGNLEWSVLFGLTTNFVSHMEDWLFGSLIATDDGGFIYSYVSDYFHPGKHDIFILKHFSNGSLEWATNYHFAFTIEGVYMTEMIQIPSGYLIAGLTDPDGSLSPFLLKVHHNRTVEWSRSFGPYSSAIWGGIRILILVETPEEAYIAVSERSVWKVNRVGTVDWTTELEASTNNIYGYNYASVLNKKDPTKLMVVGKILSSRHVFLATWNITTGRMVKIKTIGPGYGFSVDSTEDGGYYISGPVDDFERLYVAKVDEEGEYDASLVGVGCMVSSDFSMSPMVFSYHSLTTDDYLPTDVMYNMTDHLNDLTFDTSLVHKVFPQSGGGVVSVSEPCAVYWKCHDKINEEACSGMGTCISKDNYCECDTGYEDVECSVHKCFGVYSNETETVCSGRGECVDFNDCQDCQDGYFSDNCATKQPLAFLEELKAISGTIESRGPHVFGYSVQKVSSDDGFVVAGKQIPWGFGNQPENIFVAKFQYNMSLDWQVWIGAGLSDMSRGIGETSDGGFIITGDWDHNFVYPYPVNLFLGKISWNGSFEWAVAVSHTTGANAMSGYSVEETIDGGFIVSGILASGKANSYFDGHGNIFVAKFTSVGILEWVSQLDVATEDTSIADIGYMVHQTKDRRFVVVGRTMLYGSGSYDIVLLKLTSEGENYWMKTLGGFSDDEGRGMTVTSDEGFVVTGYITKDGRGDLFIAKFDDDGDLEWVTGFQYVTENYLKICGEDVKEVSEKHGGGYIVIGWVEISSQKDRLIAVKFNSMGIFEWAIEFIVPGGGQLYSVEESYDGGFVFTGILDALPSPADTPKKMLIGKISKDGKSCYSGWNEIPNTSVQSSSYLESLILKDYFYPNILDETANMFQSYLPDTVHSYVPRTSYNVLEICDVTFDCFGKMDGFGACNDDNGQCVAEDVCSCDESYYGENCEVTTCFDIFSNVTGPDIHNNGRLLCSGHGECTGYNNCSCDANYKYANDCSQWMCFSKWKNDSLVCSGEMSFSMEGIQSQSSHGNCVGHNQCNCSLDYQTSDSCDWSCHGAQSFNPSSCGSHGQCVEFDSCNCTETNYRGKFCDELNCDVTNDCNGRGECLTSSICTCWGDYEGQLCETWSCGGKDQSELDVTCSGHGKCVGPDSCNCTQLADTEHFGYFGRDCEIRVGKQLTLASRNTLVLYMELSLDLLRSTYGIEIESVFECSRILKVNTEITEAMMKDREDTTRIMGILSFLFSQNCSFSRFNEFVEYSGSTQFLRIDISHIPYMETVQIIESTSGQIAVNVYNDHVQKIELFPSHVFLRKNQMFTLKSYSLSKEEEIEDGEKDNRRGPAPESQLCKSKLQISELCVEIFECFERQSDNLDHGKYEYFSVGFMPSSSENLFQYSKIYYPSIEQCEEGKEFTKYKAFSLVRCYGSSEYGDNFFVYKRCSSQILSLFFASEVLGYFLATTSPLFIFSLVLCCFCILCSGNVFLFFSRNILIKLGIWKKKEEKDEDYEDRDTDSEISEEEKDEEEFEEDNYVKEDFPVDNLESELNDQDNDVLPEEKTPPQDNIALKKDEDHSGDSCNSSSSEEEEENEEDSLSENSNDIMDESEEYGTDESNEDIINENYEDVKQYSIFDFPPKKPSAAISYRDEPMSSLGKQVKRIICFCCCCCCCFHPNDINGFPLHICFCEHLKCWGMIFSILIKEAVSLYFASSEFLQSDDVDQSNPEYILLQNIMGQFQIVIWVSIFIYLSMLFGMILVFVGKFMNHPLQFSIGFGALKEYFFFRMTKSLFLIWFICVNLFCYILKFAYSDEDEQQKSLGDPMFWISIIIPEMLLIFSLWGVLAYNGVSSHSHLERLGKLGCCKSIFKFPNVKITWGKVTKDPDVVLENFFQLIFLIEVGDKKNGEQTIEKLSTSEEYGHLDWDMIEGLSIEELFYLKQFFFPKEFSKETYLTIFKHQRITSNKWIFTVLLFPVLCCFGFI